ncbi:hypothetical protein HK099_008071 [Clydaea vesicula]|uniref:Uncharacterized protein n=1 Tax=Clydaea vesicula TaxID=447962 RepID=A0AAD5U543_9FUNG|nr:hypothetical protein HK099_008071 [Clydaea vesicula]
MHILSERKINPKIATGQNISKPKFIKNDAEFDQHQTTQRHEYRPWPIVSQPNVHQSDAWITKKGELDGISIQKSDFINFGIQERYIHHGETFIKNDIEMDKNSTYKMNFKNFSEYKKAHPWVGYEKKYIDRRERDIKTAVDAESRPITLKKLTFPKSQFDSITNVMDEYKKKPIPALYRHKEYYTPSEAKLESVSTYADSYKGIYGPSTFSVKPKSIITPLESKLKELEGLKIKCNLRNFKPPNTYKPVFEDRYGKTQKKKQF